MEMITSIDSAHLHNFLVSTFILHYLFYILGLENMKCEFEKTNDIAFGIVFAGIMFIGVGHSMPWTLGVPLIDDNIKKRSAPLYFGRLPVIQQDLRLL